MFLFLWVVIRVDNLISQLTLELKKEIERMKPYFIGKLRDQVMKNVYAVYTPKVYERTYALIDSITVSDVRIKGSTIEFEIYFDPTKLSHYSVVTGDKVYIPPLLDEGHFQKGYSEVDYFHVYPARNFLRDCIVELKNDLGRFLGDLSFVKSYAKITKIGGKNKY